MGRHAIYVFTEQTEVAVVKLEKNAKTEWLL